MVQRPLFTHRYRDPACARPGYTFDDRSLAFTLAVMIAEWTMGVYPLNQTWGNETAEHQPLRGPPALRVLLERGLAAELDDRPSLAAFVDALDTLSPAALDVRW
jgi:hypothetical protein